MRLSDLQDQMRIEVPQMTSPFRTGSEIIVALTEELGEVAQEVALFERVGSKADWGRKPDPDALATEIRQVLNLLCVLANYYQIDMEQITAS